MMPRPASGAARFEGGSHNGTGRPGYASVAATVPMLRGRANRVSVLDEIIDGVREDLAERQAR